MSVHGGGCGEGEVGGGEGGGGEGEGGGGDGDGGGGKGESGGGEEEVCKLDAESTGSHCGGTELSSNRRARAVELWADEILRLMVLLTVAARTRPCAPVGRRRDQGGASEG